jgi:hypothetical protein
VRASLCTAVQHFTASRMIDDYLASSYRVPSD